MKLVLKGLAFFIVANYLQFIVLTIMKKTFQKLLEVKKAASNEINRLLPSDEGERCMLELVLKNTEINISLLENMV
ncbi:MAG: hypothetical protein V7K90_01490 [Nostoc sp.]|uniref:hypothetical protein n=1 Tax=Nostoc sp. TaxID=1180 RepID=UPI002FFBB93D